MIGGEIQSYQSYKEAGTDDEKWTEVEKDVRKEDG